MTVIQITNQKQAEQRRSIEAALRSLATIRKLGATNDSLHEKLSSLDRKLASNQLHLAVLGQMKRGKSSFINALLGNEILPTGVLPVTAIITEIRYGAVPGATIFYSTGLREPVAMNDLASFITESQNPGNKRQVASVEILYPSPFLERGIVLIDTPGIGSTHAHNTRTTQEYLEHVDAGIVVFSIDPPITEAESQFVKRIKEDVPRLFFILNKVDMASAGEVAHLVRFLEDELFRIGISAPEVFTLSARQALAESSTANSVSRSSGIEVFEQRLHAFLSEEKGHVLVQSVALDALHIAGILKFAAVIGARARALDAAELDQKKLALDRILSRTETEMHEVQVLLRQHSSNTMARVEQDLNAHVRESVHFVRQQLKEFESRSPGETGRAFGTHLELFLLEQVEGVFRKWRVREDEEVQAELDALSSRFVTRVNSILNDLQLAAGELFGTTVEHVSIDCPLRMESHLCYRVERVFHSLDAFLLVLPRFLLRPLVLRKMNQRTWDLLDLNAGRIRYDYIERLQATLTQFEKSLTRAVTIVTESLRAAFNHAGAGTEMATGDLDQLDAIILTCLEVVGPPESR